MGGTWTHIWAWRSYLVFFLTPFMLIPLLTLGSSEARCAYVIILMAVYWISECLPVGVTALLPVVLFPFFEIMGPSAVASEYMNDINMLFLGGLMVAVAIEYWYIHKMVALRILTLVGSEPRWLMLGLMASTWFLSMWISNTATTAMMVPITDAILVELHQSQKEGDDGGELKTDQPKVDSSSLETIQLRTTGDNKAYNRDLKDPTNGTSPRVTTIDISKAICEDDRQKTTLRSTVERQMPSSSSSSSSPNGQNKEDDPCYNRMAMGMLLSICYAANCGGIASLTGTGPNLVFKREVDKLYESHQLKSPINFGKWMTFGLPLSFIVLMMSWCWLQLYFLPCKGVCGCCTKDASTKESKKKKVSQIIREQYDALGPIVCGQVLVGLLFVSMVLLWITRDMGGVVGWGEEFDPHVKDGTAAILVCILIFALPSTLPFLKSYPHPSHPETDPRYGLVGEHASPDKHGKFTIRPLLNWKIATQKFSWQLILLMGGGYAISAGCEASGLSPWIGNKLTYFQDWNQYAILFIICYITAATTEFASNTAMASIMMPILQRLALSTGVHPLKYMLPACIACSFAYMLPVATPPNAIVFATGRLKITDMIKPGFLMNIIAVPALVGMIASLGNVIYDFDDIPQEFFNTTTPSVLITAVNS